MYSNTKIKNEAISKVYINHEKSILLTLICFYFTDPSCSKSQRGNK